MHRVNMRRGLAVLLSTVAIAGASLPTIAAAADLTATEMSQATALSGLVETDVKAATGTADAAKILDAIEQRLVSEGASPAVAEQALLLALRSLRAKGLATPAVETAFVSAQGAVRLALNNGTTVIRTGSVNGGGAPINTTPSGGAGGGGGGGQHVP